MYGFFYLVFFVMLCISYVTGVWVYIMAAGKFSVGRLLECRVNKSSELSLFLLKQVARGITTHDLF